MKRKINRFLLSTTFVAISLLFSHGPIVDSAFAYTASITTSDNIVLNVSPNGDGTSIHSEAINIQSDCRAGYHLTIATPQGSNLYRYDNGTQVSATATFTAVDGTSALNSANNTNKWGYTLSPDATSSTVFSPLSTTASILKTPSQTANSSDINDTFNISYGVKVNNNTTSGNYQMKNNGAIVYYLTMDTTCTQYTVRYHPNGGTVNGGGSNPSQFLHVGESENLDSWESLKAPITSSYTDENNNTITGEEGKRWAFWGWNTSADGTGDWYKDRELVKNIGELNDTIDLYAQWKQASLADMTAAPATQPGDPKQISHNEMQDMKPEICYNTPIATFSYGPTATLLDYRGKVIPNGVPTFGLTSGLPSTLRRVVPTGTIFGLDHFGASAPYKVLDEKFGFTPENIANEIKTMLK